MQDLASEVNKCRIRRNIDFRNTPTKGIKFGMRYDVGARLAYRYAEQWLLMCNGVYFDDSVPRSVNGYELKQRDTGIVVVEGGAEKVEYDFVVFHEGMPHIIQVKSWNLNGIAKKSVDDMEIAREIYGPDTGMLLFFPFEGKENAYKGINEMNPDVHCIDMGYTRGSFEDKIDEFYSECRAASRMERERRRRERASAGRDGDGKRGAVRSPRWSIPGPYPNM